MPSASTERSASRNSGSRARRGPGSSAPARAATCSPIARDARAGSSTSRPGRRAPAARRCSGSRRGRRRTAAETRPTFRIRSGYSAASCARRNACVCRMPDLRGLRLAAVPAAPRDRQRAEQHRGHSASSTSAIEQLDQREAARRARLRRGVMAVSSAPRRIVDEREACAAAVRGAGKVTCADAKHPHRHDLGRALEVRARHPAARTARRASSTRCGRRRPCPLRRLAQRLRRRGLGERALRDQHRAAVVVGRRRVVQRAGEQPEQRRADERQDHERDQHLEQRKAAATARAEAAGPPARRPAAPARGPRAHATRARRAISRGWRRGR